jgi:CO/xanthine dehydrogenase FAD-binding subunit
MNSLAGAATTVPQFLTARDTAHACEILQAGTHRVIAGATDVFAQNPDRSVGALLDISRIEALRGVTITEDNVRIGAITTWSAIRDAALPAHMDALRQAAVTIGGVQIQNRATIGGNVCNASPAADGVLALLALDASIDVASVSGCRRLPLSAALDQNRRSLLGRNELLEAVIVPLKGTSTSCFLKLGRRANLAISVLACAVAIEWSPEGEIVTLRACIGAASRAPMRLSRLERRLVGLSHLDHREALVTGEDVAALTPIDDIRASADYRRHAAVVLLNRAISRASEDYCHV